MYSFPNLEPVHCSMSGSNCCFLTCIQISQEAGQVVWYSYLLKNFPQFVDFPGGSDGKSVCLQCRRQGFNPWFGKIPLGKEMATHSSILVWKISWMDGGAWWAIVQVPTDTATGMRQWLPPKMTVQTPRGHGTASFFFQQILDPQHEQ